MIVLPTEPPDANRRRETERLLEEWRYWVWRATNAVSPRDLKDSLEHCRDAYKAWEAALNRRFASDKEKRQPPRN
jgi:hypothetical protein